MRTVIQLMYKVHHTDELNESKTAVCGSFMRIWMTGRLIKSDLGPPADRDFQSLSAGQCKSSDVVLSIQKIVGKGNA